MGEYWSMPQLITVHDGEYNSVVDVGDFLESLHER